MSANKTPQIHTQGNSKYLPKHVCFAGTVSERESTSKLRARAAQTLCALRSSSPGSSAPSPSARFSHPSRRLHTPSPSARRAEHGGTAPPSVTTATPAPPSLPAPPPSSPPSSYCHSLPPPAHHVYHFAIAIDTSVTIITVTAITSTTATERVKSFPTTAPQGLLLDCH